MDYLKDLLKNTAGGMFSGANDLMMAPAVLGAGVAQSFGHNPFGQYARYPSSAPFKQSQEQLTGLPITGADPGFESAFAAGEGMATGAPFGLGAMAAGGVLSATGEGVSREYFGGSPLVRLMIESGIPLTSSFGRAIVGSARRGSALKTAENVLPQVETPFPMTLGQQSGQQRILAEEAKLRSEPKTATKVVNYYRQQMDSAENFLKQFMDSAPKETDGRLGRQAMVAWNKFRKGLQRDRKALEAAYDQVKTTGARNIDLSTVLDKYGELASEYSSPGMSELSRKLGAVLEEQIDYWQKNKISKMTPIEVRDHIKELISGAKWGNDVDPGSVAGVNRALISAWDKALKEAAQVPDTNGNMAKLLLDTNKKYGALTERIKLMDNATLARFFELTSDGKMRTKSPTRVVEELKKLNPDERGFFIKIAEEYKPEIVNELRRKMFYDKFVTGASSEAKAAIEGDWNPRKFLEAVTDMKSDMRDFAFLIPDSQKRAEFFQRIQDYRKLLNSGYVADTGLEATAREGAAGLAAGITQHPGATQATRSGFGIVERIMRDPDKVYQVLFEQDMPDPSFWKRALAVASGPEQRMSLQMVSDAGNFAAANVPSSVGRILAEEQALQEQQQPERTLDFSDPSFLLQRELQTPSLPNQNGEIPGKENDLDFNDPNFLLKMMK